MDSIQCPSAWHYKAALQMSSSYIIKNYVTIPWVIDAMYSRHHLNYERYRYLVEKNESIEKTRWLLQFLIDCDNPQKMYEDLIDVFSEDAFRLDIPKTLLDNLKKAREFKRKNYGYKDIREIHLSITELTRSDSYMGKHQNGVTDRRSGETRIGGQTKLMVAVMEQDLVKVTSMILRDDLSSENINQATTVAQKTALMMASIRKNEKITEIILSHKQVNANMYNSDGMTALMCALLVGHTKNVEVLLNSGKVDVNLNNNINKISGVCYVWGHKELIDFLAFILSEKLISDAVPLLKTNTILQHYCSELDHDKISVLLPKLIQYLDRTAMKELLETCLIIGNTKSLNFLTSHNRHQHSVETTKENPNCAKATEIKDCDSEHVSSPITAYTQLGLGASDASRSKCQKVKLSESTIMGPTHKQTSVMLPCQNDDFEARFVFERLGTFPQPEPLCIFGKTYPSQNPRRFQQQPRHPTSQ